MAANRRKKLVITDEAQRAAMTSPARLEILEHLGLVGPATVRDLAERMERSPHALHYHVRRLVEVGLMVQTGSRKSGPRDQAVYDVVADRLEVDVDDDGLGTKTMRSMLRCVEREFEAVAATDPDRLGGKDGFTGRLRARLSIGARNDVMRHLQEIQRIFEREFRREHPPQARVETYNLTAVFLPDVGKG
jgi:predicted transcriptional regulator